MASATAVFVAAMAGMVVVLGGCAGTVLERARWVVRFPALAVTVWLGVVSVLVAALSGLVVVGFAGPVGAGHRVLEWMMDCLRPHSHPGGAGGVLFSVVLAGLAARAVGVGVARFARTIRRRRAWRSLLLVADDSASLGDVRVIDHPLPVAYCLPDRRRPIVVSSGALRHLGVGQLSAVLAHERAHVRGRHHLITAVVDALAAGLWWLPTVRQASRIVPGLLEMCADDVAAHRHGRAAVASALRRMAVADAPADPAGALGAATGVMRERLRRLDDPSPVGPVRPVVASAFAWLVPRLVAVASAVGWCGIAVACAAMIPLSC